MMLAVPSREGIIDGHFGHCEYFTVYSTDGKAIVGEERVDSPAGCGCKSNIASVLRDKGVSLMIAGNMGDGAVRVLKAQGIDVIRGCSGPVRKAAEDWLSGALSDSGEACHSHEHECSHG